MRLKRVRLSGFKTFADRAEFDIDGGVVAVVGPNGCGKSNLVDAILWGLGEGNARHLRAQTSHDVIFSGSTKRKGVGFAEVSLLFDNEDGVLPIESSEVSVSRRLTRSGDSEYSINKHACRQRDVYDLLADSGLGRAGYSIVGQKEIDQALAASPEERRSWVDEAAGVQRYRARKMESQRRLASAQSHLARVSDIVRELEHQREPLREEAEVALRYRSAHDTLKSLEVGLLAKELVAATADLETLAARVVEAQRLIAEENKMADAAEANSKKASQQTAEIEREIELLWSVQQRSFTAAERAEAEVRLAEQRLISIDDLAKALSEETALVASRITESKAEVELLLAEQSAEKEALAELHERFAGISEQARQAAETVAAAEKELFAGRQMQAQRLRSQAEESHRTTRLKEIALEMAGIDSALPELRDAIAEGEKALKELAKQEEAIQKKIANLESAKQALHADDDAELQQVREWLAEKASLEGRKQGIEATIQAHEGLSSGSRAVLKGTASGELKGAIASIAESLEIEKQYAIAIEAALESALNDLVTPRESDAIKAIEYLKSERSGRCTLHVSGDKSAKPATISAALLKEKGVLGLAIDLVRCETSVRPIVERLLEGVLVVDDLQAARSIQGKGWTKLATLDGDVLHSSGALTGGVAPKAAAGVVSRKSEAAEIGKALIALEKSLATAERKATERSAKRDQIAAELGPLRTQLSTTLEEQKDAGSQLNAVLDEFRSTERSQARLAAEKERLKPSTSPELDAVDIAALEMARDEALRIMASKTSDSEGFENRLRDAEMRLSQATIRLDGAKRRAEAALDSEAQRQSRIERLEPDRQRLQVEIGKHHKDAAKAHAERIKAEEGLAKVKAARQELVEGAHQMIEDARLRRANATSIGDGLHQLELSRARAESKRASAAERLLEEYGISEEQAAELGAKVEVPPDAVALVHRLRRELRAMGTVNLGAIDAFERLNERCTELEAQRIDIEGGIEQVMASISELDKLTRDRFLETFAGVQQAFSELFVKLFAGGEGNLSLTLPNAILDTGIEIDVTLPGKKRQRLELLSGGERALCACAFLFALLKVKPSPLVVLDEVDAPLDGRNVERFVELLEEFSQEIQFIVVTHNPTTIAAAPVWLGVTMQEPGVSTLVPTRMAKPLPAKPTTAVVELRAHPVPA